MPETRSTYHHGNLAESLLNAVDEIARKFGLEAVTLRGCAKQVGVSPSSAFRHYADKRALMTAFACRALNALNAELATARDTALANHEDAFTAVCRAYVRFAIHEPALFRAMWREETIYREDADYVAAADRLAGQLCGGFAGTIDDDNPAALDTDELLTWSAVHGLASLFIDGPVARERGGDSRMAMAEAMIERLRGTVTAL